MEEGQIDPGDLNNSTDVSHLQEMAAQSQSEVWFGPMGLLTWHADAMFWPLRCKTSFDFRPVASQLANTSSLGYLSQSTSIHACDATTRASVRTRVHVYWLIASVIRARLGKDRQKWKFHGIAVHTRCFVPDKIYRRPRANVDTILIATLTRIKDKCPAACHHRAYHFQLYEDHPKQPIRLFLFDRRFFFESRADRLHIGASQLCKSE